MPLQFRPASIRARLILLVLALWIPAVAGLALQTHEAYLSREQAAREEIRQQAQSLRFAVQAEIDRRVALARALAALPSLRSRDLAGFDRDVRLAVKNSGDAVLLLGRDQVFVNTLYATSSVAPRVPGSMFVEGGLGLSFVAKGPFSGKPALAVLVPEAAVSPPEYNVGVRLPLEGIQELIARQPWRDGITASVIDAQQRVMGRSRDPEKWLGQTASHTGLRALAQKGGSGFIRSTTLDGVASLTYLSPPGPYGWASVVALPEATLQAAAWELALRAVAVSALLLGLGLLLALIAARRISHPVRALEQAAGELLAQRVPQPLHTGLAEIDRVGAVLHDAGARSREWEQVLESRVKQAVEETRQAEARLFDARKHEAIGRLTGGLAHDFNNLLQTISMGMQVVQRSVPDGRHTRPLQAAISACSRAAELVRQMLAFGRAQQLRPQPVSLADLLLRSQELTGKALGERVQFDARLEPALPAVLADPAQLELAVLNLVFNARDAMPYGGTVTLRASVVDGAPLGLDDVPFVRIDVQDTGHGMDPETLARVFEPYFTTKPVGAGSGLGLPQVQAFARQSGGDVRIASAPGEGTTVAMFLPVSRAQAEGGEEAGTRHVRRTDRSLDVLMVEDDVLVASVVQAALEHERHRVTLCRTADEAKSLLAQGLPADVLFTDIVMPGVMTGIELVEWCRASRPELPALVATGYSTRAPQGVWKLLRKPYTIEDLLDALDACAARETEEA